MSVSALSLPSPFPPTSSTSVPWTVADAGLVRQGTCGWSDESLIKCGRFYPPSLPSTHKLEHYSRCGLFSCVEVDSSTYAIPSSATVKGWCDQVPSGFVFHIKAFGLFCSQSVPLNALPRAVREMPSMSAICKGTGEGGRRVSGKSIGSDALDATWQRFNQVCLEVQQRRKMGMVIFQFQLGFRPGGKEREEVLECRRRLDPSLPMAVEFRDRAWQSEQQLPCTRQFLSSISVVMILCDDLKHELMQPDKHQVKLVGQVKEHLPIPLEVTQPGLGVYIRLHRRQGENRVLQDTEFLEWMERLRELRARPGLQGPIFFLWGTDYEDQPLVNAQRLRSTDPCMFLDWKAGLEAQSRQKSSGSLLSFFTCSGSPGTGSHRALELSRQRHTTLGCASRAGGASAEEQKQEEDHCPADNKDHCPEGALPGNRGGGIEAGAGAGGDGQTLHSPHSTQESTPTPKRSISMERADDAPPGVQNQRKLPRHSLSLSEQRVKELSEQRVTQLSNFQTSTADAARLPQGRKQPTTPSGKGRKTASRTSTVSKAMTASNASKPISSFFTKS